MHRRPFEGRHLVNLYCNVFILLSSINELFITEGILSKFYLFTMSYNELIVNE